MATLKVTRGQNIALGFDIPIATQKVMGKVTLFSGIYSKSFELPGWELDELKPTLRLLEAKGTIVWSAADGEASGEALTIASGYEVAKGSTPSTISAYKWDLTGGEADLGSTSIKYSGALNADPLALGIDADGASVAGAVLAANGFGYKIRVYATLELNPATGVKSVGIVPLFSSAIAAAELLDLTVTTDYVTDAAAELAFAAANARLAATRQIIDKLEIARVKLDRASGAITEAFWDLKELAPQDAWGLRVLEREVDHADADLALAAGTATILLPSLPEYCLIHSAYLRVTEAVAGVAAYAIEIGDAGDPNGLATSFDIGTGAAAGNKSIGPKALTAGAEVNTLQLGFKPVAKFTAGANLNTATAGKFTIGVLFTAMPESATGTVVTDFVNDSKL